MTSFRFSKWLKTAYQGPIINYRLNHIPTLEYRRADVYNEINLKTNRMRCYCEMQLLLFNPLTKYQYIRRQSHMSENYILPEDASFKQYQGIGKFYEI